MITTRAFVTDPGGETFLPGDPPHGVCWSPRDGALAVDPTWVRMDDPQGYRLVSGWSITRGRQSETDRVGTGTATIIFNDADGILDPTNPSSPFWNATNLATMINPMHQAAIALMNPVTGAWHTLFRGFIAGPDHELEMYEWADRGLDITTWNLVDAFDVFANVVLTPGMHGYPATSMTDFPNIIYNGTFLEGSPFDGTGNDVEVHVDARIVKLLDDAGWPGTGLATAPLRNVFSGNVTVQGAVYARSDSLMSALGEAVDAEFPNVGIQYMSKDGVYTFHGRYARFNPDTPGYGINRWYVGDLGGISDATIVPFVGPLRFYRSKDDIVNSSMVLPANVDASDPGVVVAADTVSQNHYGFRSLNFENLLTAGGHDSADLPTTAVEECNRFASYFVGNKATPQDRVQTLRFRSRGPDAVNAAAFWELMTRVELGDVITLTTTHTGAGSGFNQDFYVEQISYEARPGRADMHDITLELEVSPAGFYSYDPFT